jgi:hypothetical protein
MMAIGRPLPTIAALAALSLGCASVYTPREPGRIHLVKSGAFMALEKDGKTYATSGLWRDPIEAVSGNPRAEERARTFVSRTRLGTVLMIIGAVGYVATFAALAAIDRSRVGQRAIPLGIVFGASGSVFAGLGVLATSRHQLYDAVNIYNDDVSANRPSENLDRPEQTQLGTTSE